MDCKEHDLQNKKCVTFEGWVNWAFKSKGYLGALGWHVRPGIDITSHDLNVENDWKVHYMS